MPQTCTVCRRTDVQEINESLIAGEPYRNIAARTGLSTSALVRHKSTHLSETLLEADAVRETLNANSLTRQIEDIRDTIRALLQQAIESENLRDAHNFAGDTLKQIELEAKLEGQITAASISINTQVNIYQSPEWGRVGSVLARILAQHPELRLEVSKALLSLQEVHT